MIMLVSAHKDAMPQTPSIRQIRSTLGRSRWVPGPGLVACGAGVWREGAVLAVCGSAVGWFPRRWPCGLRWRAGLTVGR